MKIEASRAVLDRLAAEQRRVLSAWRATLLLRRATREIPGAERRWRQAPASTEDVHPLLRRMEAQGEIRRLLPYEWRPPGLRKPQELGLVPPDSNPYRLYEVTVPYARFGPIDETEVLMEVHPYATLAYRSALVFHGLTDELPKDISAVLPADGRGGQLPPGTARLDWEGLALIRGTAVPKVFDRPIQWFRLSLPRFFGMADYRPHGYPVRVMTPERTLVEGLQQPDLCGGIETVLRAWVAARDLLEVERVVQYTERFGIAVLRQRVGYVLEMLGLHHPMLAAWRQGARRGGSSKLLGSAPYAPVYSERWSLSLNAPVVVLEEATG